jgi:PAS domain-containing protein
MLRLKGITRLSYNAKANQEQSRSQLSYSLDVALINKNQLANRVSTYSEEVYKSLVDHVGIGVFRTTPGITGRFLEVNPAIEEITGYSREELLQMNVADLFFHPEEKGATFVVELPVD